MIKRKMSMLSLAAVVALSSVPGAALVSAEDVGFEVTEYSDEVFDEGFEPEYYGEPEAGYDEAVYQEAENEVPADNGFTEYEATESVNTEINWKVYAADVETDLSDEDQQRFINATSGLYGEIYQPVSVLATQLVAGMNYAYLCRLVPITEYQPVWMIAVVYEDLEGNVSVTSIRDLNVNSPALLAEKPGNDDAVGAWTAAGKAGDASSEEASRGITLPEEAEKAFRQAMEGYDGASVSPIALLADNETGGNNYLVLCRGNVTNPEDKGSIYVAAIHKAPERIWADDTGDGEDVNQTETESKAEVIKLQPLDLLSYLSDGPRTYITGNGVLSIVLPDYSWKAVQDEKHLAAFSDGNNRMELSHLVNGEAFDPVMIADESYAAVYQAFYSTPEDVYIVTGAVKDQAVLRTVRDALQSVQVLRYGTDPVPAVTPTPEPTPTPADPRGEMTGWEATVYADHSTDGIAIFEYTNGIWYDGNRNAFMAGDGIESGYIWYDESGNPYYLFAYPYELRRTGNTVDVSWDTGLSTTLQEFTDGVWRDFRYVTYNYAGNNIWTGDDGSSVTGMAPPASEDDELDAGSVSDAGTESTEESSGETEEAAPAEEAPTESTEDDAGTDSGTGEETTAEDSTEVPAEEESIIVE